MIVKNGSSTTDTPLTASAVAKMCGVALKTVHDWANEKQLAHFRTPGRHLRFRGSDVEQFMANGFHTAIPDAVANVVSAAVGYVKKPTKGARARLDKAVAALPEAS